VTYIHRDPFHQLVRLSESRIRSFENSSDDQTRDQCLEDEEDHHLDLSLALARGLKETYPGIQDDLEFPGGIPIHGEDLEQDTQHEQDHTDCQLGSIRHNRMPYHMDGRRYESVLGLPHNFHARYAKNA